MSIAFFKAKDVYYQAKQLRMAFDFFL